MAAKKNSLKPRRQILVVEAGGDKLKILSASAARGGLRLNRVHVQRLEAGQSVAAAIKAAVKKHKLNPRHVIGVLPRAAVSIRLLELPSTDEAEIADMIEIQAARQTPYSRDEIMAGYRTLAHTRRGTYSRVMLAIVQRSAVRERFHELERGGLDVDCLAASTEGLLAWGRQAASDTDAPVAVLDMDATGSDLLVIRGGDVLFSKQITMGADLVRRDVAGNGAAFAAEIDRALTAGAESAPGLEVGRLLVTGAVDAIDGLPELLQRELSVAVEAVPPTHAGSRDVKGGCALAAEAGLSVVPLIGMAMDPDALSISLIPEVVRMRRRLASAGRSFTALAALIMTALTAGSLWLSLAYLFRAQRAHASRAAVEALAPRARRIEHKIEVVREVRQRRDTRFTPLSLLPELHAAVPDGVYFGVFDVDSTRRAVRMAGTAPARRDVRTLIANLEASPLFRGAMESGRNVEDNGRFLFEVSCTLAEVN